MCIAYFRYYSLDERICYLLNKMTQKNELIKKHLLPWTTDTQRELFFKKKTKLLGLGRQIGPKNFGAFVVHIFGQFWYCGVPIPCFRLINHYFYKKLSLFIQIQKTYLGVVVEFGPERIRNLVIVCP